MEPAVDPRLSSRGAMESRISYSSEVELKTTLRELVIYIIFLINLCIVTFGMVNMERYFLNRVMSYVFLEPSSGDDSSGFSNIRSRADFWRFAEGPLLDGLYWDKWYNNATLTPQNKSYIYYENLLLGVAQIRQLKVRNNSCAIYPYFHTFIEDCYSDYHYRAEDRSDFGLGNGSEWKYTSASSLSPWYWGSMSLYNNGGYMFTLPRSKQESMEKLAFLRQNSWLTRGTRVVFIDFSTYNANLNLFCVIKLVAEFPATGGALTSSHIYSVKLLRYVTYYDYFLASCEIVFCLFIITFIIQEAIKMVELKKEYFRSAWNWLELLLLGTSVLAIAFNIYRTVEVSLLMEELLSDDHVYPDFYFLAFWQVRYNNMVAINVFFAWIKIFKYVNFNKTMTQLSSTLSRCAKDLTGFAIIFFTIFFAYAQLGYLAFGSQAEEFSSFQNCIFTQFRIVLGDFNFHTIESANRVLGPIYFITFVFFVFFVLLNVFLAIINYTYSEVKAAFEAIPSQELKLGDLFRQGCNKVLVMLKLKKPQMDTNAAEESLDSKEFSATQRDSSELSNGNSASEKSHLSLSKLQQGEERLHEKPPSTEDMDRVTAQSYVSTAQFQQLLRYTMRLGSKLNNTNVQLRRVKRMQQLKVLQARCHSKTQQLVW
ncbi:polycystin-2-like protein 2 [Strix uralensis]|uniref:polycystin-2-like protein 2 n=1 Tax=Strix uralensis TaxID=36305 RepID=UPI003DA4ECB6